MPLNTVLGGVRKFIATIGACFLMVWSLKTLADNQYSVVEIVENTNTVIYSMDASDLSPKDRAELTWLVVISWDYSGSSVNGMPGKDSYEQIRTLKKALSSKFEGKQDRHWTYNRTGNDLFEMAFYIDDRERFINELNSTLQDHPRYPIQINFYKDEEWQDFQVVKQKLGL